MKKVDVSKFQGYLVGQIIASSVGALLLAFEDFAGFYYRSRGVQVTGYIYLGSGILSSLLILLGLGGLLLVLRSSIKTIQLKDADISLIREHGELSIRAAGFTAALAAVGAVVFVVSSLDTEWWLDSGFYGAFVGGILTVFFGTQIIKGTEETDP